VEKKILCQIKKKNCKFDENNFECKITGIEYSNKKTKIWITSAPLRMGTIQKNFETEA